MERYEIRRLAAEHYLDEWAADGWETDRTRGEVCVGDSWFPIESLPKILLNHMTAVREAQQDAKRAAMADEALARVGNTWQSRARRLAAELAEVREQARAEAASLQRDNCDRGPCCLALGHEGTCRL